MESSTSSSKKTKLYKETAANIEKMVQRGTPPDVHVFLNQLRLLKTDVNHRNEELKSAARQMIDCVLTNGLTYCEVVREFLLLRNSSSLFANKKAKFDEILQKALCNLFVQKSFNLNVLTNGFSSLELEMFYTTMHKSWKIQMGPAQQTEFFLFVIEKMFEPTLDDETRIKYIDLGFNCSTEFQISNLHDAEVERFKKDIVTKFVKVIEDERQRENRDWHKLWIFLVKFGEKHLHSIELMNKLLRIVEHAFRNPNNEQRIDAYNCWKHLIDNASLDMEYICSIKQIKLLLTPLKAKFSKHEDLIIKRFKIFTYLLEVLQTNATLCLNEYLEFCFGANGQGKGIPSIWLHGLCVLIKLLGYKNDVFIQDLDVIQLNQPIITKDNFGQFYKIVINSAVGVCLLFKKSAEPKTLPMLTETLWFSLFNLIKSSPEEVQIESFELFSGLFEDMLKESVATGHFYKQLTKIIYGELLKSEVLTDKLVPKIIKPLLYCKLLIELPKRFTNDLDNLMEDYLSTKTNVSIDVDDIIELFLTKKLLKPNTKLWIYLEKCISVEDQLDKYCSFLMWPATELHKFDEERRSEILDTLYENFKDDISFLLRRFQIEVHLFTKSSNTGLNVLQILQNFLPILNQSHANDLFAIIFTILNCTDIIAMRTVWNIFEIIVLDIMGKIRDVEILTKLQSRLNDVNTMFFSKEKLHSFRGILDKCHLLIKDNTVLDSSNRNLSNRIPTDKDTTKLSPVRKMPIDKFAPNENTTSPLRLFGKDLNSYTPKQVRGSFFHTSTRSNKILEAVSKSKKTMQLYNDESADFEPVDTEVKVDVDKLNDHQKEVLAKRREDIPALYQDLTQSQGSEEFVKAVIRVSNNKENVKDKIEDDVGVKMDTNVIPETEPTQELHNEPKVSEEKKHRKAVKVTNLLRNIKMDIIGVDAFAGLSRTRNRKSNVSGNKVEAKTPDKEDADKTPVLKVDISNEDLHLKKSSPKVRRKSDETASRRLSRRHLLKSMVLTHNSAEKKVRSTEKPKVYKRIRRVSEGSVGSESKPMTEFTKFSTPDIKPIEVKKKRTRVSSESVAKNKSKIAETVPNSESTITDSGSKKNTAKKSKNNDESADTKPRKKKTVVPSKIALILSQRKKTPKLKKNPLKPAKEKTASANPKPKKKKQEMENFKPKKNKETIENFKPKRKLKSDKNANSTVKVKKELPSDDEAVARKPRKSLKLKTPPKSAVTDSSSPKDSSRKDSLMEEPKSNINDNEDVIESSQETFGEQALSKLDIVKVSTVNPAPNNETETQETLTCESSVKSLTPVIQYDLPEKPVLTESEVIMAGWDTLSLNSSALLTQSEENAIADLTMIPESETLRSTVINTPGPKSLPTSPVNVDTPERTNELLNNTSDISPIRVNNEEVENKIVAEVIDDDQVMDMEDASELYSEFSGSERSKKLLSMLNVDSPLKNRYAHKRRSLNILMSPSSARNKKLMKRFGSNKIKGDTSLQSVKPDDVLTFSRQIPSALAIPKISILKRKAPDTVDEGITPCSKRKRVNFSDPPTTSEKLIINDDEQKQRKFQALSKNLFDVPSQNSVIDDEVQDENNGISEINQTEVPTSSETNRVPIYENLIECKEPVDEILQDILNPPSITTLVIKLSNNNITTIGDLARLTEEELKFFPFKVPVVKNVYDALDAYYLKGNKSTLADNLVDTKNRLRNCIDGLKNTVSASDLTEILMESLDKQAILNVFTPEDVDLLIKQQVKTKGAESIVENLLTDSETSDSLNETIRTVINNKSVHEVLESRSLEDIKEGVQTLISRKIIDKKQFLKDCVIPLIQTAEDTADLFESLKHINYIDIKQMKDDGVPEFIKHLKKSYGKNTIISCCTQADMTTRMQTWSSSQISSCFQKVLEGTNSKEAPKMLEDIFTFIGSRIPLDVLLRLHVNLLKRVQVAVKEDVRKT